jgi:hypothetical protein
MKTRFRVLTVVLLAAFALSSTSCVLLGAAVVAKAVKDKKAKKEAKYEEVLKNPIFQKVARENYKIAGMREESIRSYPGLANINADAQRNFTGGLYPNYSSGSMDYNSWALVMTNNSLFLCWYGEAGSTYPFYYVWLEVPFQMIESIHIARHDPPVSLPDPNLIMDKQQVIGVVLSKDLFHQTGIGWKDGRTPAMLTFVVEGFGKKTGNIERLRELLPGVKIISYYK